MRYKYTITKEGGETEEMEAMSWKKMLKSLLLKTPKFSGKIAYLPVDDPHIFDDGTP